MDLKRIFEGFEKFSRFLELNEQNVSGDCSADHSQVDHPFRFESSFNHPEITEPLTADPKRFILHRSVFENQGSPKHCVESKTGQVHMGRGECVHSTKQIQIEIHYFVH